MAVQRNETAPECGSVNEPCASAKGTSNAPGLSPSLGSAGVWNLENCARTRMNTGIERIVTISGTDSDDARWRRLLAQIAGAGIPLVQQIVTIPPQENLRAYPSRCPA